MTIMRCKVLYRIIEENVDYKGLYRALQDHAGLYRTIQDLTQDYTELFMTIQDSRGL